MGQRMTVVEYLRTPFEPDCEYLDGEVVERNAGEFPHSQTLAALIGVLAPLRSRLQIQVLPVIHIRIHEERYRVADVGVWRAGYIGERIPTVPPFLAIEVLSPGDGVVRMHSKIMDYFSIGVEWIWLVDPSETKALVYSQKNGACDVTDVLRTENPPIEIPLKVLNPA